ncbi:MAG: hypothetical protein GC204_17400 [Chloroflexi bacterium]|nr:hypothetical protein [Chloroflexota bacterium]
MSTPNDIAELLRKGIEAAREGKREVARGLFEQVVELDEKSEKGWFWLASVVESDEERRICLGNVLHINPNNERAKRALDTLQAQAKSAKPAPPVDQEEVLAGVTRRQLTLIIGVGAGAVVLILLIALVVIIGNNNRQAAENATQTAIAQVATNTASAATAAAAAVEATGTSVAATAAAQVTLVPPTAAIATLPPTWTPTPQATLVATQAALPMPEGLTGRLAMWGGQDMLAVGYLPLGYFDFDMGSLFTVIGTSLGKNISFSADGQRVAYTNYDQLLFSSSMEAINLNGTQKQSLPELYKGQTILEPHSPRLGGPFRQFVVFVAHTDKQNTDQVFLLNLNAPQGANPVKQLTADDSTYSDPALSPDGGKVIAVRSDLNAANQIIDLVSIDVATGGKIPVTNDGASFTESGPFFTKDGSQVLYAAAPSNDLANSDIFIKSSNGGGSALPFYRGAGNDIDPVLSPDGKYLAFANNSSGAYDIFVYEVDGAKLSQLTNTPEDEFPGDWWQP